MPRQEACPNHQPECQAMTTDLALTVGSQLAVDTDAPEFRQKAGEMAREFQEATAEIRRLAECLDEQCSRLHRAFARQGDPSHYNDFGVSLSYRGRDKKLDTIMEEFSRNGWRVLFDH